MYQRAVVISVVLGVVLALVYAAGLEYSLFWRLWWYDIPAHFLGGALAALVTSAVCAWRGGTMRLWWGICAAVLVGIAWEAFEWTLGLPPNAFMSFALDTTKDLLMDVVGGISGVALYRLL